VAGTVTLPGGQKRRAAPAHSCSKRNHLVGHRTRMWFDRSMTDATEATVIQASRVIAADAERLCEFIADPARQRSLERQATVAESR